MWPDELYGEAPNMKKSSLMTLGINKSSSSSMPSSSISSIDRTGSSIMTGAVKGVVGERSETARKGGLKSSLPADVISGAASTMGLSRVLVNLLRVLPAREFRWVGRGWLCSPV